MQSPWVKSQATKKYNYIKLSYRITEDNLYVTLNALRPLESKALLGVIRDNMAQVLDIADQFGLSIWFTGIESHDENSDFEELIASVKVEEDQQWWEFQLTGDAIAYPGITEDDYDELMARFVALFPIYQATCERLDGLDDHFAEYHNSLVDYISRFEEGEHTDSDHPPENDLEFHPPEIVENIDPEISAQEGEVILALERRRRRDNWLRDQKVKHAQRLMGSLRCEVPGCGFDFLAVYGERGRGFAHVHHKNPLSDRSEPSLTKLDDLAIVCANCHAMLHRGGEVIRLVDLIPAKP